MRICSICKLMKPLTPEYFYRSKRQKDGFHSECKECAKVKDKSLNSKYYIKNADRKKQKTKERRTAIIMFVENWKMNKTCKRCGETDHRTFEFHHRCPTTKDLSIGKVAKHGWSIARVQREIDKCDLLCANCHRITDSVYAVRTARARYKTVSEYIIHYKQNNPCHCGVSDYRVLEFHHKDTNTKLFNIGDLRYTMNDVVSEIQKCEVSCANCHRRKHYEDIRPEFRRQTRIDS